MDSRFRLNRGDEVSVELKTSGRMMLGEFLFADDGTIVIKGTSGNHIGHDCFIPWSEVEFVERLKPAKDHDTYPHQ